MINFFLLWIVVIGLWYYFRKDNKNEKVTTNLYEVPASTDVDPVTVELNGDPPRNMYRWNRCRFISPDLYLIVQQLLYTEVTNYEKMLAQIKKYSHEKYFQIPQLNDDRWEEYKSTYGRFYSNFRTCTVLRDEYDSIVDVYAPYFELWRKHSLTDLYSGKYICDYLTCTSDKYWCWACKHSQAVGPIDLDCSALSRNSRGKYHVEINVVELWSKLRDIIVVDNTDTERIISLGRYISPGLHIFSTEDLRILSDQIQTYLNSNAQDRKTCPNVYIDLTHIVKYMSNALKYDVPFTWNVVLH